MLCRWSSSLTNIYVPGKFKDMAKEAEKKASHGSMGIKKYLKPKIVKPFALDTQEMPLTKYEHRMIKFIKEEVQDILVNEPLPRELHSGVSIVSTELAPNKGACYVYWRPVQGERVDVDQIAKLLDKYTILFRKLVATRMSYGVNERKFPKLIFKIDKSGEMVERLEKVLALIEQEQSMASKKDSQ